MHYGGIYMILRTSSSKDINNPNLDDIREVLKDYEQHNNILTQASLWTPSITLVIDYDDNYGFYILELNGFKAHLGKWQDKSLLVVHDMGGDPFLVPLCCHMEKQQAEEILWSFIQHDGKILDYSEWYDIYEEQDEAFIDNKLFGYCGFGELLKIANGKVRAFVDPFFGELEYDEYEGYKTFVVVKIQGKDTKVDLVISNRYGRIENAHNEAFEALMKNWDNIIQVVFQSIIEYQDTHWYDTDHMQSFPKFETMDDVVRHTEIFNITLMLHPEHFGQFRGLEGRFAVLLFGADWVNDDYRILSVALINEKVVEVTDQNLTD